MKGSYSAAVLAPPKIVDGRPGFDATMAYETTSTSKSGLKSGLRLTLGRNLGRQRTDALDELGLRPRRLDAAPQQRPPQLRPRHADEVVVRIR